MKIKYILLLFLALSSINPVHSQYTLQSKISCISTANTNAEVILRWAPITHEAWQWGGK